MSGWKVVAADCHALRDDIGEWLVSGGDWALVAELLHGATSAAQRGDLGDVRRAVARLELLSPLAKPRLLILLRAPQEVLERFDRLVHQVDRAADERGDVERDHDERGPGPHAGQ